MICSLSQNTSLRFGAEQTRVNDRSVQNSLWRFDDSDPDYYVLTSSQRIVAGDQLSFGLTGSLSSGASPGVLTVSSVVLPTRILEAKPTNNTDADKVGYFR